MIDIKCRYSIPHCTYPGSGNPRLEHWWGWFCASNDFCGEGHYTEPDENPYQVINPQCKYCKYTKGEFEKSVKSYFYEDGFLRLSRKEYYCLNDIDYLEIDGKIRVQDGEIVE